MIFQDACSKSAVELESRISGLKEELEKREQEKELPPEEATDTTAPLYRQMLLLYCEEQATEDAIFVLGDGLRKEVVTIEIYLKVRIKGCIID